MTTTIALCSSKGGTAKTTSTILLGTALARAGHSVLVYDADPQGSATAWADLADETDTPLPFAVEASNARSFSKKRDADVILIDCPPGQSQTINAAIDASDVVIIPTTHSGVDADRMWDTIEVATSRGRNYRVLITVATPTARTYKELEEVLEEEQVAFFDEPIRKREAIKHLWGLCPGKELFGYDDVAAALEEVIANV